MACRCPLAWFVVLLLSASSAVAQDATTKPAPADSSPAPSGQSAAYAPAQPAAPAAAQTPAPPARIVAGQDGFAIESGNGDFRLQLGVLLHGDARFALDDEGGAVTDTFLIRRVRPYLRGRFARRFEFYLNPDFAGGTLVLQDAYVDTVFSPKFRVRAGKAKSPFGFERLHFVGSMLFQERALPTAIAPNRDVGVQVLGDVYGGRVSYLGGILNGVPDGASGDVDTNDGKDLVGRLVLKPFAGRPGSPLRPLSLAFSASVGSQSGAGALPSFRTPTLQQQFFAYSGALADGVRTRYSPQVYYWYKAAGGWAEYVRSEMPIRKGDIRADDVAHDAWQVAGWVVLTGETPTDATGAVRPRANFDFGAGHYGALQVAVRYHTLAVEERAIRLGLAGAAASRLAEAWTVGLNWYLTPNFKYVVNFERTVFDGHAQGARGTENAVAFRTQVYF